MSSFTQRCLLSLLVGGLAIGSGAAQEILPLLHDGNVYTYVENFPSLPGGGSAAIGQAIGQRLSYPPRAERARVEGQVFVRFIVRATGLVENVEIVKSLRPDCDSAALAAVRQLPRFEPGQHLGKPVAVSFVVPITFRLPPPLARPKRGK